MVITNNSHFRTADTALAAYLVTEGFGTPSIDNEGNEGKRSYFIFSKHTPKMTKAIEEWDAARATTNAVLFFNAYQNLLRRIREKY